MLEYFFLRECPAPNSKVIYQNLGFGIVGVRLSNDNGVAAHKDVAVFGLCACQSPVNIEAEIILLYSIIVCQGNVMPIACLVYFITALINLLAHTIYRLVGGQTGNEHNVVIRIVAVYVDVPAATISASLRFAVCVGKAGYLERLS